ncbi:hypothetical protein BJV78DRAFT_1282389 [Lactifluus subvellereus]|nr:hypothetical protein BJV78DRAFT_1282389 [Lactifluus subvellereus]
MLRAAILGRALIVVGAMQALLISGLGNLAAGYAHAPLTDEYSATCKRIAMSISPASQVFYPGSQEFNADIAHFANSSSDFPTCTVEPGTLRDVGLILQQISLARVPFAVKGGGHTTNPGFSSTPGVHISMSRFNDVVIREDSETVEIGAGLTWTDVYAYLIPKGINVVGGHLKGIGVAGFTLGGGYSWKTSQYGLTIDTVTEFELVTPNGEVKMVTEKDKELWFALRGGFNNYGIVTKFTLKSHKQTDVWGAILNFAEDLADVAQTTFAKFLAQQHDHKAAQLGEFVYSNDSASLDIFLVPPRFTEAKQVLFGISLFYDAPAPPEGLYDDLLSLPATSKSIFKGTFPGFISSQFLPTYNRSVQNHIHCSYVALHGAIMKAFVNETKFWGDMLSKYDKNVLVVYSLDPFEPGFLTHGGLSAYPPDRSLAVLPSSIYCGWTNNSADKYMADAMRRSAAFLVAVGIQDGQDLDKAAPYVNYALFGTPLEKMYGQHLGRLREIRKMYDPEDIMGLAGGWKF